jgi:hypothetical protein
MVQYWDSTGGDGMEMSATRKTGRRSRCAAHWRPFLAPSMARREASVWGSVSGPLMPSSHAGFGLAVPSHGLPPGVRRPSGNFRFACRRSSGTVTTPGSVASTLPCHLPSRSTSRRLLRPQSPFNFKVSATFQSLARLMDARARERDGEYSESSRSTLCRQRSPKTKRKRGRPSGPACCFVFGYRLGPVGPTGMAPPHADPAVHSRGLTALHLAAHCGNRRIVRSLVASGADVNAQNSHGSADSACGERRECSGRVPAAVCRAGSRRSILPRRAMAHPTSSPSCS